MPINIQSNQVDKHRPLFYSSEQRKEKSSLKKEKSPKDKKVLAAQVKAHLPVLLNNRSIQQFQETSKKETENSRKATSTIKNLSYDQESLNYDVDRTKALLKKAHDYAYTLTEKEAEVLGLNKRTLISPSLVYSISFVATDIDKKYPEYKGAIALYDDKNNTVFVDAKRFGLLTDNERVSVLIHELSHAKQDVNSHSLADTAKDTEQSVKVIENNTLKAINLATGSHLQSTPASLDVNPKDNLHPQQPNIQAIEKAIKEDRERKAEREQERRLRERGYSWERKVVFYGDGRQGTPTYARHVDGHWYRIPAGKGEVTKLEGKHARYYDSFIRSGAWKQQTDVSWDTKTKLNGVLGEKKSHETPPAQPKEELSTEQQSARKKFINLFGGTQKAQAPPDRGRQIAPVGSKQKEVQGKDGTSYSYDSTTGLYRPYWGQGEGKTRSDGSIELNDGTTLTPVYGNPEKTYIPGYVRSGPIPLSVNGEDIAFESKAKPKIVREEGSYGHWSEWALDFNTRWPWQDDLDDRAERAFKKNEVIMLTDSGGFPSGFAYPVKSEEHGYGFVFAGRGKDDTGYHVYKRQFPSYGKEFNRSIHSSNGLTTVLKPDANSPGSFTPVSDGDLVLKRLKRDNTSQTSAPGDALYKSGAYPFVSTVIAEQLYQEKESAQLDQSVGVANGLVNSMNGTWQMSQRFEQNYDPQVGPRWGEGLLNSLAVNGEKPLIQFRSTWGIARTIGLGTNNSTFNASADIGIHNRFKVQVTPPVAERDPDGKLRSTVTMTVVEEFEPAVSGSLSASLPAGVGRVGGGVNAYATAGQDTGIKVKLWWNPETKNYEPWKDKETGKVDLDHVYFFSDIYGYFDNDLSLNTGATTPGKVGANFNTFSSIGHNHIGGHTLEWKMSNPHAIHAARSFPGVQHAASLTAPWFPPLAVLPFTAHGIALAAGTADNAGDYHMLGWNSIHHIGGGVQGNANGVNFGLKGYGRHRIMAWYQKWPSQSEQNNEKEEPQQRQPWASKDNAVHDWTGSIF